jgi:hypothetical protein
MKSLKKLLRGEVSLPKVLWLFAVLGAVAIFLLFYVWDRTQLILVLVRPAESSFRMMYISTAINVLATVAFVAIVPVSIWRSARNYTGRRSWAVLAKVGVVVLAVILSLSSAARLSVIGIIAYGQIDPKGLAEFARKTSGRRPQGGRPGQFPYITETVSFTLDQVGLDPAERVASVVTLPEGNILAITNAKGGPFAYKISNLGRTIWRKELLVNSKTTAARSAGIFADGTYWIAGTLLEKNQGYDFVQHIDADGNASQPTVLANQADSRFFRCAVEHQDKFIDLSLIGGLDQYFGMDVPALSMTDGSGVRLWETLVPFDKGRRIEVVGGFMAGASFLDCAGILLTVDDRILAAQRILIMTDSKSDEAMRQELNWRIHLRPGTLLIALDLEGREVARVRHDNVIGGRLIPTPGGALLFETSYKTPGVKDLPGPIDQLLRIYTYDSGLRELKPPIVIQDSYLDVVNNAYPSPEGGLLMAGCTGKEGLGFIRYITPAGLVTEAQLFNELGYCGSSYWFSPGARPGEALLLMQTPNQGNRLLTVKYSN